MDLATYISDPERAEALANDVGTSTAWLWQIATRWRNKRASAELATKIDRATRRLGPEPVARASLRPDLFFADEVIAAANDDVGPREEDSNGLADATVHVKGAQGAESEVHAASMECGPAARYVHGDAS